MTRNYKKSGRRSSKSLKRNTINYMDDVGYQIPLDDERTPKDIPERVDISNAIEELCKTMPFFGVACNCTFEKAMIQPFPETGFFEWIDEINERHIVFIFAIDSDGIATQWRLM